MLRVVGADAIFRGHRSRHTSYLETHYWSGFGLLGGYVTFGTSRSISARRQLTRALKANGGGGEGIGMVGIIGIATAQHCSVVRI